MNLHSSAGGELAGVGRAVGWECRCTVSSQRLGNDRSTLGKHLVDQHPHAVSGVRGRRDYDTFFENFDFKVVGRERDSLGTFLRENLEIERGKPKLNECQRNGFVF